MGGSEYNVAPPTGEFPGNTGYPTAPGGYPPASLGYPGLSQPGGMPTYPGGMFLSAVCSVGYRALNVYVSYFKKSKQAGSMIAILVYHSV